MEKPIYLEGSIKVHKETAKLRETASKVLEKSSIELPEDKQIDLLYFSAIFVSSGTNLNYAHFLPSELIKAEGTIVNKALDIEHEEDKIIGHIYDRHFIDSSGKVIDIENLKSLPEDTINNMDMHVVIAGIVYKARFPQIAKEIEEGNWKVSMEAMYPYYDVKVGNIIMDVGQASALGIDDSMIGKSIQLNKSGQELAAGELSRVLRGINFSGCGIVKQPANPPSIITDVANKRESINKNIDLERLMTDKNKVTSKSIEISELQYKDSIGICIHYKKEVYPEYTKTQDTEVLHRNWCTLFNTNCTSFSRDTSDPDCLKNIARNIVLSGFEEYSKEKERKSINEKINQSLDRITILLTEE